MLVSGGMLIENDKGRRYDRFRGRVMFPIHDRRGKSHWIWWPGPR